MNKFVLLVLSLLYFNSACATQTGRLFIIDSSWENEPKWFDICLYEDGKVDCDYFVVYGRDIYIRTKLPVKSDYGLNAGIKPIRGAPRYGCTIMSNNYCAFKVMHDKWSYIKLE